MSFPAYRHADGTISSSDVSDVWRMASEDSDELVPGFTSIHRLRYLRDLRQTIESQVVTARNRVDTESELLEVESFRSPQRMPLEERNYRLLKIRPATNNVAVQVLAVVVIPPVRKYLPDSKELTELMETIDAACALCHRELV
jgi:hypothetical protein